VGAKHIVDRIEFFAERRNRNIAEREFVTLSAMASGAS